MNWPRPPSAIADHDLTRRQLLSGGGALAAGKAVDNAVLGFGVLTGTNLREQNLAAKARERFEPSPFAATVSGHRLRFRDGEIRVSDAETGETRTLSRFASRDEAATLDTELGLAGDPAEQLVRDLSAIDTGAVRFEFSQYEPFFVRVRNANNRPFTVHAMRGNRFSEVSPSTIESFAGTSPTDPEATLEGVAEGFREHTEYDIPQYLAGSVEDNVVFGAANLRQYFESPTTFDALESGETEALLCWDFTWRAIEALHAAPAHRQHPPVLGAKVVDARHGHVYVGAASVIRENGNLVVPMTFVDYRNSTLADDLSLRGIVGESLAAYDERHRATDIYWQP